MTPGEVATLAAMAAAAYLVALVGVTRNRRGDALPSLGILAWLERAGTPSRHAERTFGGPEQAQFWLEWRQNGLIMVGTAVMVHQFAQQIGDVVGSFATQWQAIVRSGALEQARARANEYAESACTALDILPDSDYCESLRALPTYILERDR